MPHAGLRRRVVVSAVSFVAQRPRLYRLLRRAYWLTPGLRSYLRRYLPLPGQPPDSEAEAQPAAAHDNYLFKPVQPPPDPHAVVTIEALYYMSRSL